MKKQYGGFTLVELLTVVAIIGILVAVAAPAYSRYVTGTKRVEARAALMNLVQAQEQFRANCDQYADTFGTSDECGTGPYQISYPTTTETGLYQIALTSASEDSFTATATAVAGRAQAKDSECRVMTLSQVEGAITTTPTTCWR